MKQLLSLFLAGALVGSACGQTAVPPASGPVVTLWASPTPPAPNPALPTSLEQGQICVINASAPITVLASPPGVVTITADQGPIRISGLFVDGDGKRQSRNFKGPNVYLIEPTAAGGTCELIVVSSMDSGTVIRRTIVATGSAPTPPPVPITPPAPTPPAPPPVDPNVAALKAALASDGQPVSTAAALATVCQTMANVTSQDPAVATYQDLLTAFGIAADKVLPPATTPATHRLVGSQLQAAFSKSPVAVIDRGLAKTTFTTLAAQLGGVK